MSPGLNRISGAWICCGPEIKLLTNVDHLLVGQLVDDFFAAGVFLETHHFFIEVVAHVTLLFLDVLDDVLVVVPRECESVLDQQVHQVLGNVVPAGLLPEVYLMSVLPTPYGRTYPS